MSCCIFAIWKSLYVWCFKWSMANVSHSPYPANEAISFSFALVWISFQNDPEAGRPAFYNRPFFMEVWFGIKLKAINSWIKHFISKSKIIQVGGDEKMKDRHMKIEVSVPHHCRNFTPYCRNPCISLLLYWNDKLSFVFLSQPAVFWLRLYSYYC